MGRSRTSKTPARRICLVYDNYNALAVGFGPTESLRPTASIALYPALGDLVLHVGATLDDPKGLLGGKVAIRSVRLEDGLAMLKSEPSTS